MDFYKFYKKYGIYLLLAIVVTFFSLFASNFLSFDNFMNVLRQVSMFGIVVIGVTFVMISGGADLSVGGQMAVNGMIAGLLMAKAGMNMVVVFLICMVVGAIMGALNGYISVKLNIFSMIVTLGTMLMLQGIAYVITGGYPIFGIPKEFTFLGQGYIGPVPFPVVVFAVIVLIAWFVLNRTYFGRYIYALGGSPEAARLAGINVNTMRIVVFGICGFITAIASMLMLSRTNSAQPGAGSSYPFDCMTAAVLGGISFAGGEGNIGGAVVGVLIIGVLNNGLQLMGMDANWQGVIKGIVLIAAVGIDCYQSKAKKVKVKAA